MGAARRATPARSRRGADGEDEEREEGELSEIAWLSERPEDEPDEPVGRLTLKPCPFCGGSAELIDAPEASNEGAVVACCTACQASGPCVFGVMEDPHPRAAAGWNRRTAISEFAWLAEMKDLQTGGPLYYGPPRGGGCWWRLSADDAIRFCRKEDAERVIEALRLPAEAVEHGWAPTKRASQGGEG